MFNEDLKYIIKSTLVTFLPIYLIIILTEYILGFLFNKEVVYDYVDINIKALVFTQILGLSNLIRKPQYSIRDEFEKVITLRIIGLNTVYYIVGVVLTMYIIGYATSSFIGKININALNEKIFVYLIILLILLFSKLKSAKKIITKN